eukprot:scaffold1944_cov241-Pinguiococcus_pyrenoidosus.AAC.7
MRRKGPIHAIPEENICASFVARRDALRILLLPLVRPQRHPSAAASADEDLTVAAEEGEERLPLVLEPLPLQASLVSDALRQPICHVRAEEQEAEEVELQAALVLEPAKRPGELEHRCVSDVHSVFNRHGVRIEALHRLDGHVVDAAPDRFLSLHLAGGEDQAPVAGQVAQDVLLHAARFLQAPDGLVDVFRVHVALIRGALKQRAVLRQLIRGGVALRDRQARPARTASRHKGRLERVRAKQTNEKPHKTPHGERYV